MANLEISLSIYDDEADLLAALKRGDDHACTCLVKRFADFLYRPARQIVADEAEAESVVQQTFIKACDNIASFEGKSQLKTWLYRIATNEALMVKRRHARHENTSLEAMPIEPPLADDDTSQQPDAALMKAELQTFVSNALEQLPESLREVVILRSLQGLSTAETATQLGLSESAVKVRLHRARQQIREQLEAYLLP